MVNFSTNGLRMYGVYTVQGLSDNIRERLMGGRASRVKGANGEREFFKLSNEAVRDCPWKFRDREGNVFFRHPAPRHGKGQPDNSDPHGVLPVTIEVKRVEKPQFKTWIDKLQDQARESQTPVLAWRKNGKDWTIMPLLTELEWKEYLIWRLERASQCETRTYESPK